MPDTPPTADELRGAARLAEDSAAAHSEPQPPLRVGDAQSFPREDPGGRALRQSGDVLYESAVRASAALLALAAMRDREEELPAPLLAEVKPYLEAYQQASG